MAIFLCSLFPLLCYMFILFVSSSLLLCCSSLFVRGARDGNFDRDWSLQHFGSFPRSAVRTRLMVTDCFVRVFALVSMCPSWSRWYCLLCVPLFVSCFFFALRAGLCLPSSVSVVVALVFSAMFRPLPFFSSLLFFSGHFELRIRPSHHHTIIPSSLCLSIPGPAECAKR